MDATATIPIIFFGTHDFAATILSGLIANPIFDIQMVFTQPDRPVGRHHELQASPVKRLAMGHDIPVDDPATLRNYELRITNYELMIVAQYGLLIPKRILDLPKRGTINVHTSLLPKYRGASPIQSAIMNGEDETGITIMLMDEGLDTGPILAQTKILIDPDDTYFSLDKKMAETASELLKETVPRYLSGEIRPVAQANALATACRKLDRDDGRIDWNKPAREIYNLYRGLFPWPGVWTLWNGKRIKILEARPAELTTSLGAVVVDNGRIFVGAGEGSLQILKLQMEGKQEMSATEFLNGYKNLASGQLN